MTAPRLSDDIEEEAVKAAVLPHLLLGITRKGIEEFMQRISFPDSYARPDHMHWVTSQYGAINTSDGGRIETVGYDLAEACRAFLEAKGCEHLSVCEFLHGEGNPHVGRASAFYSHSQMFDSELMVYNMQCYEMRVLDGGRTYDMSELWDSPPEPSEMSRWWIDYFVLRQCRNDWDVAQISTVIRLVGHTVAELDNDFTYLRRSFCLFELFATAQCGTARLECQLPDMFEPEGAAAQRALKKLGLKKGCVGHCVHASDGELYVRAVQAVLAVNQVDARAATCTWPADKAKVDALSAMSSRAALRRSKGSSRRSFCMGQRLLSTFGVSPRPMRRSHTLSGPKVRWPRTSTDVVERLQGCGVRLNRLRG